MKKPVYLDYNATTPHDPEVIEAIKPYLETEFGNPSSSHYYGSKTKRAVENARDQVAGLLNCNPDEIIFTGGGTESNNYAIMGIANLLKEKGNHIITSSIEHPAVTEVCRHLQKNGFSITYLPVDNDGIINPANLEKAITDKTILITIMHANNEVGSIQPVDDISRIAKKRDIIFHTDAAQSLGKIPVNTKNLGIGLLSVAGHKLYASKGIGALYVKKGLNLNRIIYGAGQENGRRAGTENVMGIVGLGRACEIIYKNALNISNHLSKMRDLLYKILLENIENIKLNSFPGKCLPNTLSVSFKGIEANMLLNKIQSEVVASAGAACHSHSIQISHVLEAMNIPLDWAKGTIRLSTGKMTTEEEVEIAGKVICEAVSLLKSK